MSPFMRETPEPTAQRLDRLVGLLGSHQSWTGPELAAELGVSLRTVRRDMARLAARGVPIETERGRGGGVRVPPRAGLGRLQLHHREAIDLLLALAISERLQSPLLLSSLRALRQKIGMAFPPEERSRIGRLRRRILHGLPATPAVRESLRPVRHAVLEPIQEGFFLQRALEIQYRGLRGKTTRLVDPHYLLVAWPAWYMLVWDHLRGAVRTLRVDRVAAAHLTERSFKLLEVNAMLLAAKDLEFTPI